MGNPCDCQMAQVCELDVLNIEVYSQLLATTFLFSNLLCPDTYPYPLILSFSD